MSVSPGSFPFWRRMANLTERIPSFLVTLIVVLAAVLRLTSLDIIQFTDQFDELKTALLAIDLVDNGVLPQRGVTSSVGVATPPLVIYLLALPYLFSKKLEGVLVYIGLLNVLSVYLSYRLARSWFGRGPALIGAALFAVSPWAIVFSRRIWAADFVPLFAVGWLWAIGLWVRDRKPGALWGVLVLGAVLVQLHLVHLAAVPYLILLWLLFRPPVRPKPVVLGVLVVALLFSPYLYYQWQHDVSDFRQAFGFLRGRGNEPDKTLGFLLQKEIGQSLDLLGEGGLAHFLGSDSPAFRRTQAVPEMVGRLEAALFGGGLIYITGRALLSLRLQHRFPYLGAQRNPHEFILSLWYLVPLLVMALLKVGSFHHYFTMLYPTLFLVTGLFIHQLGNWLGGGPCREGGAAGCPLAGLPHPGHHPSPGELYLQLP